MSVSDFSQSPLSKFPTPMGSVFPTPEPSPMSVPESVPFSASEPGLTVDDVQRYLNRSRASVYRYANTDPDMLNPPYDPTKLNPELRQNKDEPLLFRPQEVRRFAEEVLGLQPVIQVQPAPETVTTDLLRQILAELQAIRRHLEQQG